MVTLSEEERERGRRAIHGGKVEFGEWLGRHGGAVPDIGEYSTGTTAVYVGANEPAE